MNLKAEQEWMRTRDLRREEKKRERKRQKEDAAEALLAEGRRLRKKYKFPEVKTCADYEQFCAGCCSTCHNPKNALYDLQLTEINNGGIIETVMLCCYKERQLTPAVTSHGGTPNRKAKILTVQKVAEVRRLFSEGVATRDIARIAGLRNTQVSNIRAHQLGTGRYYKDED